MLKSNRGDFLRWTLLGVLGAPLVACGGTAEAPGTGGTTGSGGADTTGGGGTESTGGGGADGGSGGMLSTGGSLGVTGGASSVGCENPVDMGGGFERCEAGQIHREARGMCPSEVPRAEDIGDASLCSVEQGCCISDADCTEPNQYCGFSGGLEQGPSCRTGCVEDADCSEGMICLCGSPMGQCVAADCTVDADCSGDLLCTSWSANNGCSNPITFTCEAAADECAGPGDCQEGQECVVTEGVRHCQKPMPDCVIGRPFLVQDEIRTAPVIARADWDLELSARKGGSISPALGERLAAHFELAAQMEHASIGAFARFSLQLLALGAPAFLIEETNQALIDETRHARQCFALASRYRGSEVGPGPLDISSALAEPSPGAILITTILEGCVGETVAALEAAEAAANCVDSEVREILLGIAHDEGRHAELAWKFARWVIAEQPELAAVADRVFAQVLAPDSVSHAAEESALFGGELFDDELASYGVLSKTQRREVRRTALRQVVRPCAQQLLRPLATDQAPLLRPTHGSPKIEQYVRA